MPQSESVVSASMPALHFAVLDVAVAVAADRTLEKGREEVRWMMTRWVDANGRYSNGVAVRYRAVTAFKIVAVGGADAGNDSAMTPTALEAVDRTELSRSMTQAPDWPTRI